MSNNNYQVCTKCNELKNETEFMKIISRQTYGIGCDDDGYVYYIKLFKLCHECRHKMRLRTKKN